MKMANWIAPLGLTALLALSPALGATQPQRKVSGSSQAAPLQPGSQAAATLAVAPQATKEEDDAYKAIFDAQAGPPAHLISLGEAFVGNFPMSAYRGDVYALLTKAYLMANQPEKMTDAGMKALASNPNNVDVLAILAWTIPRQTSAATGQPQLQQAAAFARHAIDLLNATPKPATMNDATFAKSKNEDLAMCHSGLGVVDVKTGDAAGAITELTQAVQLAATPSMVDYYLLGVALEQTGQFTPALGSFGKCAVDGSPVVNQCKVGLNDAGQRAKAAQGPRPNAEPR